MASLPLGALYSYNGPYGHSGIPFPSTLGFQGHLGLALMVTSPYTIVRHYSLSKPRPLAACSILYAWASPCGIMARSRVRLWLYSPLDGAKGLSEADRTLCLLLSLYLNLVPGSPRDSLLLSVSPLNLHKYHVLPTLFPYYSRSDIESTCRKKSCDFPPILPPFTKVLVINNVYYFIN